MSTPQKALAQIKHAAFALADQDQEYYTLRDYPWKYAADFLLAHKLLIPTNLQSYVQHPPSLASMHRVVHRWADQIGVDAVQMAEVFADAWLLQRHVGGL